MLLLFTFGLHLKVNASSLNGEWRVKESRLTYHLTHPLKTVEGQSTQARGKARCRQKQCEFLVAAPLNRRWMGGEGSGTHGAFTP